MTKKERPQVLPVGRQDVKKINIFESTTSSSECSQLLVLRGTTTQGGHVWVFSERHVLQLNGGLVKITNGDNLSCEGQAYLIACKQATRFITGKYGVCFYKSRC